MCLADNHHTNRCDVDTILTFGMHCIVLYCIVTEKVSKLTSQAPISMFDQRSTPSNPKELEADLNPAYDISQVRAALTQLKSELKDDRSYVTALQALRKITSGLISNDASSRTIASTDQMLAFSGSVSYLKFIGFVESKENNKVWTVIQFDKIKTERAGTILKRVLSENSSGVDSGAAVDRNFKIFDVNTVTESSKLAPAQAPATFDADNDEDDDKSPAFPSAANNNNSDAALILATLQADKKKNELLNPSDRFVTKSKRDEIKNSLKRRYPYTRIRVMLDDVMLQATFGPNEVTHSRLLAFPLVSCV